MELHKDFVQILDGLYEFSKHRRCTQQVILDMAKKLKESEPVYIRLLEELDLMLEDLKRPLSTRTV